MAKIKELKGFESIQIAELLGRFLRFFEEDFKQRGQIVAFYEEEKYSDFYEACFKNPWIFGFSKEEIELILSFCLDDNGIPLNEANLDYSCEEFVESFLKPLFDKVFFMKIVKPVGFAGYTFQDAVGILVKNYQPSQIELKSVFEIMVEG